MHVAARLGGQVRAALPTGLEEVLTRYAKSADAATNDDIRRHMVRNLVDLRTYIYEVIHVAGMTWLSNHYGVTNHAAFLGLIGETFGQTESVAIVTFNYDTLIENAITKVTGWEYGHLNTYPGGTFKLFKLHGSTTWGRELDIGWTGENTSRVQDAITDALLARGNVISSRYARWEGASTNGHYWVPAIAVPLLDKPDFECPQAHIDELVGLLPQVDRVITIGWRGQESAFLDLLDHDLPVGGVPLDVVGTSNAQEVAKRLALQARISETGFNSDGFSGLVGSCTRIGRVARHDEFNVATTA